jgi:chromosomal replication initiator protein
MNYDATTLWESCLSYLSERVNERSFNTWLKPTRLLAIEGKRLLLAVPNKFVADWLEQHYLPVINEAVESITGEELALSFAASGEDFPTPVEEHRITRPCASSAPAGCAYHANDDNGNSSLNPRYSFDTFVVGESNQFAQAAAMAVAESPGKTRYNPLFIYGGVGLGKTHLLQAIGHFIKEVFYHYKVLYVTSEKFTNDFIAAVSTSNLPEFTNTYRLVDILLLDDIQFFTGKESTQVQFFHTFNALYQSGKQIVLTSDRPPKDIAGLEERLLSRFQWGLVTDIQPPDLETRIAILRKKCEADEQPVPEEVIVYIADNITNNIRVLEGCLTRLLAYFSLKRQPVTLPLAKEILKDCIHNGTKEVSIEHIQKVVAEAFNVSEEMMWSKKKTQEVVLPRQVAMYLVRKFTRSPLKSIGLRFGGRDHSTVIHSCNQVKDNLKRDPSFKLKIDGIINSLFS